MVEDLEITKKKLGHDVPNVCLLYNWRKNGFLTYVELLKTVSYTSEVNNRVIYSCVV